MCLEPSVWADCSGARGIPVGMTHLGICIQGFVPTVLVGEDAVDGVVGLVRNQGALLGAQTVATVRACAAAVSGTGALRLKMIQRSTN